MSLCSSLVALFDVTVRKQTERHATVIPVIGLRKKPGPEINVTKLHSQGLDTYLTLIHYFVWALIHRNVPAQVVVYNIFANYLRV